MTIFPKISVPLKFYLIACLLTALSYSSTAQQAVDLALHPGKYILRYGEIELLEDVHSQYQIQDVVKKELSSHFIPSHTFVPKNYN